MPAGLGRQIDVSLDVPQAVVDFGGPGLARKDPDFMAAYLINHILGGGSSDSRLYQEVREKRGLAYSVSNSLVWLDHSAVFLGGTATRADRAGETVDLIEKEIHRFAEQGSDRGGARRGQELCHQLVCAQSRYLDQDRFAPGAIAARQSRHRLFPAAHAMIDAVTLDDAKRVAKRLLDNGMLVTVVGRPEGVASAGAADRPAGLKSPGLRPLSGSPIGQRRIPNYAERKLRLR